jgi:putative ABC transport system permease protein
MAWRDSRRSRRRLLLYSSTIVLGIAALVAVGSLGDNLRKTVAEQPKRLLGADLRVGLDNWPNPDFERHMDGLGARWAREKIFPDKLSFRGYATPQAVQVVALDGPYPFYGEFTTEPADGAARLRRGERVVLLDPSVAKRLHIAVGDPITIGSGSYTMAGIVREFPGDSAFSLLLTSRAFLPWSSLPDAPNAAKKPVHGNYRFYFQLPAGADVAAIAAEIKSRFSSVYPVVMTSEELGKKIDNALVAGDRFFSLVVFVALFLGAIGVASTLHIYIQERLRTVAILRCVGSSAATATGIYLCQAAALGICGSAGGALVGVGLQLMLPALLKDLLPFHLEVFFAGQAVAAGMVAGFFLCMVFALLPLLAVRRTSPLAALRSDAGDRIGEDPLRIAVWAMIAASVFGFAWWQARNVNIALAYTGALAVAFAVFAGASRLVSMAARRCLPSRAPYPVRQGVANLYRPGNRTTLLLLSLGLGLFIVLTVYMVRSTLLQDLKGENTPNLVLGHVADTDLDPVLAVVKAQGAKVLQRVPVLDVTLESVNGKPWSGEPGKASAMRPRFRFPAKLQATYRANLLPAESLTAGQFTGHSPAGAPVIPVSVVPWMVRLPSPLHLGDEAVWNVEGVPIRTRITSVRAFKGMQMEPNFPLLFPQGALDGAPRHTILLVRARTPADSAAIQRAVGAYPGVRIFDIAFMIETVQRVFAKLILVVDFIAFFTIATGMVILAATVITGRHQRARETVLLRVLGATRRQLRCVQLTEYAVLGALSAVIGGGMAKIANVLLAHFLLHIPAAGGYGELSVAAFSVVAVAVITGVFADRGLANLPPLEILREEG